MASITINKIVIKKNKNSIRFDPIRVSHGDIDANGYLFNGIVYISDCSSISKNNLKKILNPNLLIIDCLKFKKHATHLNFKKSLFYINKIKPKKTILTNLHSDIDYSSFKKKLKLISNTHRQQYSLVTYTPHRLVLPLMVIITILVHIMIEIQKYTD